MLVSIPGKMRRRILCALLAALVGGLVLSSGHQALSQGADSKKGEGLEVVTPFARSSMILETWDGRKLPFVVEEATTPTLRSLGLMFRTKMLVDEGMLFVWEDDQPRTMWMKNTYIPLDMLFLNEHGIILRIAQNTTPRSEMLIAHADPARAVLEINAGMAVLFSIEEGDRVLHPLLGATEEDMRRDPEEQSGAKK